MKTVWNILLWVLSALNVAVTGAMAVCTYSVYLPPHTYPNWSYLGMVMPLFLVATILFIPVWVILRWKRCLISVVGIAVCWNGIRDFCPVNIMQGEPEGKTLRVMSYNVYSFLSYNSGKKDIAGYIAGCGADIVCLQEVSTIRQVQLYDQLKAAYPYIEVGVSEESNCALLSVYPILSISSVDLNSLSASCYFYDVLIGTDTVKVINCHLESYNLDDEDKQMYKDMIRNSNPLTETDGVDAYDMQDSFLWLGGKLAKANSIRSLQADTIASLIDRIPNKYVIMCGDFNDSPLSYVHKTLTRKLKDSYTESGNGPGSTYNRNGMYFRIDNIIISDGFNSFGAKVDKTIYESDHYPIFCTLEML